MTLKRFRWAGGCEQTHGRGVDIVVDPIGARPPTTRFVCWPSMARKTFAARPYGLCAGFLGLKPTPPQRYPLSEAQAALQCLADGGVLGKLTLER